MSPSSPVRHETQQGPMSAKTKRLLKLYEDELGVRYGERTAPQYLSLVRCFLDWVFGQGIDLTEVRTVELESYRNELLSRRKKNGKLYSLSWQHGHLKAIKSLFRFLYRGGYLLQDPAGSIEFHHKENRLPRVILSPREAFRIIEAANDKSATGLRDRALLETLYATGIRVTELANLTLWDVNTEERTLKVVMGKGKKDRNVPLTAAAARAIDRYIERGRPTLQTGKQAPYLFLSDLGGWMHRAVLSRIVARYARRAKLKKHVTCHTFRHSVATHLLQGRADIRHIQELLGHASVASTQRYTRVEISDLRKVIARAHPRN